MITIPILGARSQQTFWSPLPAKEVKAGTPHRRNWRKGKDREAGRMSWPCSPRGSIWRDGWDISRVKREAWDEVLLFLLPIIRPWPSGNSSLNFTMFICKMEIIITILHYSYLMRKRNSMWKCLPHNKSSINNSDYYYFLGPKGGNAFTTLFTYIHSTKIYKVLTMCQPYNRKQEENSHYWQEAYDTEIHRH